MLQLPIRADAGSTRAVAQRAPAKSSASELVDAFMAARRQYKIAAAKYEELCAQHPDLEDHEPTIFLFTNGDGQAVYGKWADIKRFFPQSNDGWSPGTKTQRERLQAEFRAASDRYDQARKSAGLKKAFSDRSAAYIAVKGRLLHLCRHSPSTLIEAREIARVVRKYLPEVARDYDRQSQNIYGEPEFADFDNWRCARSSGFQYLATLVLSFGKMGVR